MASDPIARLRAVLEAATPGPWTREGNHVYRDTDERTRRRSRRAREAHYLTHGDKGALVVAIECSAGIRWERPWGEDRHPAPPECPLRSGPVTVRRPGSGGAADGSGGVP